MSAGHHSLPDVDTSLTQLNTRHIARESPAGCIVDQSLLAFVPDCIEVAAAPESDHSSLMNHDELQQQSIVGLDHLDSAQCSAQRSSGNEMLRLHRSQHFAAVAANRVHRCPLLLELSQKLLHFHQLMAQHEIEPEHLADDRNRFVAAFAVVASASYFRIQNVFKFRGPLWV